MLLGLCHHYVIVIPQTTWSILHQTPQTDNRHRVRVERIFFVFLLKFSKVDCAFLPMIRKIFCLKIYAVSVNACESLTYLDSIHTCYIAILCELCMFFMVHLPDRANIARVCVRSHQWLISASTLLIDHILCYIICDVWSPYTIICWVQEYWV